MRNAAASLMLLAGNAFAHPGHGAPEAHIHAFGPEHALLLLAVAGLLAYALRK